MQIHQCMERSHVTWKLYMRRKTKLTKERFRKKASFKTVLDFLLEPKKRTNFLRVRNQRSRIHHAQIDVYAPIIGHPLGGTPGKGGNFVKDPVKVLISPLLGGDTEESKFPSLRGITLSSLKPDKKTVLYTLNEMSCFNSAYMFVTMQISMYC